MPQLTNAIKQTQKNETIQSNIYFLIRGFSQREKGLVMIAIVNTCQYNAFRWLHPCFQHQAREKLHFALLSKSTPLAFIRHGTNTACHRRMLLERSKCPEHRDTDTTETKILGVGSNTKIISVTPRSWGWLRSHIWLPSMTISGQREAQKVICQTKMEVGKQHHKNSWLMFIIPSLQIG